MAKPHVARFERWQRLAKPQTRALISAIASRVVPVLEAQGFHHVEVYFEEQGSPVSGGELRFERKLSHSFDAVEFNFEKYGSPRVQVHAYRHGLKPPHDLEAKCNLVARPTQYYHFWGKPWWVPASLWRPSWCNLAVSRIVAAIPQAIEFLESGTRGTNINLNASFESARRAT